MLTLTLTLVPGSPCHSTSMDDKCAILENVARKGHESGYAFCDTSSSLDESHSCAYAFGPTSEWIANSEGVGAWIQITLNEIYHVKALILTLNLTLTLTPTPTLTLTLTLIGGHCLAA